MPSCAFHFAFVLIIFALSLLPQDPLYAQAGLEDDRVMMQGFYWESYRHGHPERFPGYGEKTWYQLLRAQAASLRAGRFDMIWLPPPAYAGAYSAGYNPKEYFNLTNSYGDQSQHRALLVSLLENGIEPIADIVINHRDGSEHWGDFQNPAWGPWAITRDDEAFTQPASELYNTPLAERGHAEQTPQEYAGHSGTTYAYNAFRDLDHSNPNVRRDILRYLLFLKAYGYRGWRYDMVHGYHARWVAFYNRYTHPTFSVGEYDWDKHAAQRGWIWHSATLTDDLATASSVFDFSTFFTLKDNKGDYTAWYGFGNGIGLVGDTTDNIPWKNRAVTFLENHDTGYRTHEDGTPQQHHEHDTFLNDWQVEQGYAHILTHPGVPVVYWKHYFDWGLHLHTRIKALINARKVAGVHAGSVVHTQSNARTKGVYAARVVGRHGDLYVRIGGSDADWQPQHSDYKDYREYAAGTGWKVWVGLPGNPALRSAALKNRLPIPEIRQADDIVIPEEWLRE